MVRYFRRRLEVGENLVRILTRLTDLFAVDVESRVLEGNSEARLASLELSRLQWEGEMEALVVDAKGQYRSASNAEGRAKTHAKAAKVFEEGDEESEEDLFSRYLAQLTLRDGNGGELDGVQNVPDVLVSPRQTGRAAREARKASRRAGRS